MLRYVATLPVTVGLGRLTGKLIDSVWPFLSIVARGPDPPPERTSLPSVAMGDNVPSAFIFSEPSVGTHMPPERTRCGRIEVVTVKVPSGFAEVISVGEVNELTSTATPLRSARSDAAAGLRVTGGEDACAATDCADEAPNPIATSAKAAEEAMITRA